ncbi:Shedu anti-phage system protein SduA domain-containing protein [Catellatospora chokoriensis]|uniref:Shedu protein SduA C-terminal domain-containing protein n=1 Tax=Catellatospora chokoriensis TaxID=310353 RepID=A0A8J3NTE9_9ACTN|nr:Shedu anti-phage system protein SduA domain-containing protein [Catellatospora chokoriensis]GIF91618.1 hypothetical protein Cch02nite_50620 [Catellatospora chokoriensis]
MVTEELNDAVRAWWDAREDQRRVGPGHGTWPVGEVHRVIDAVISGLVAHGVAREDILTGQRFTLERSYRSMPRTFDIAIVDEGVLVAAIDFSSSIGPYFGNNFNNRVDDFLGLAADNNRALSDDVTLPFRPCLGIVFMLEHCERSSVPVRLPASSTVPPSRRNMSYQELYEQTFQRLLDDNMYDAICYLTTSRPPDFAVQEPSDRMTFSSFLRRVADRVAAIRSIRRSADAGPIGLGRRLAGREDVDDVLSGITSVSAGLSAAEGAVIRQRRQAVAELQQLARDRSTNETQMHKAIGDRYWLFGGQYVGMAERRNLVPLDEHDITLICADGSLHVVELKGPDSRLIKRHRNHFIVSSEVHEAVSQCQNYLVSLDEMGASLRTLHRNELGLDYDYRRARGTVVIGHPDHVNLPDVTREQVERTLRAYNAQLTRVQVVTYAELLDAADRALMFAAESSHH